MRLPALLSILLASTSASAIEVRVKSEHDKVMLQGSPIEFYKVEANQGLRGATIGPGQAQIWLRRLGPPKAPAIKVRLFRDGRQVAFLKVAGKPRDPISGEIALASVPLLKVVEIPQGPHSLSVEVGPGNGSVLVSFDERTAPAPLPRPPALAHAPMAPDRQEADLESAPADLASNAPKDGARPAASGAIASEQAKAPIAAPAHASQTAFAQGKLTDETVQDLGSLGQIAAAERSASPLEGASSVFQLGARAGFLSQVQLGTLGIALGLTTRWRPFDRQDGIILDGLTFGVSADFLRGSHSTDLEAQRGVPDIRENIRVTSIPVLAEASYSLGAVTSLALVPTFSAGVGAALGSIGRESVLGEHEQSFASPAWAIGAGVELPLSESSAQGKLGLEVRFIGSRTPPESGTARNYQVGALLAQASWRFTISSER